MTSLLRILSFCVALSMLRSDADAQVVTDTFGTAQAFGTPQYAPISYQTSIKRFSLYKPQELAAKGIVPGVYIYGVAYHKSNNGTLVPGTSAMLQVKMRCGDPDTMLASNWSSYTFPFVLNSYLTSGFSPITTFFNGSSLALPATSGWIPLMLDGPFLYTGGTLEVYTDWEADVNATTGFPAFSQDIVSNNITLHTEYPNSMNSALSDARSATIIYHTENPPPCGSSIQGGNTIGPGSTCANQEFTLYLLGSSAGPGISYQWQSTPFNNIMWTDIPAATLSSYTGSASIPMSYRCAITCANGGYLAHSSPFTTFPTSFTINSIVQNISGNTATFTIDANQPSLGDLHTHWNYGNGDTAVGDTVSYPYILDGTYTVQVISTGGCGTDTATAIVMIGCPWAPTYQNVITATDDSICSGQAATLITGTLPPSNYTPRWERKDNFGNFMTIIGANSSTLTVSPTITTTYRNRMYCNSSNNSKISNEVTIHVSPAPQVTGIMAANLSGNTYEFNANGIVNVQQYHWDFGDGDTSSLTSPNHHYPNAGTYTITLIVTNTTSGCTDTATTTISITTSIEEEQPKAKIRVYPDPASDVLHIEHAEGGRMEIWDMSGKMVKAISLQPGGKTDADISQLPDGVYSYSVIAEGVRTIVGKITILH